MTIGSRILPLVVTALLAGLPLDAVSAKVATVSATTTAEPSVAPTAEVLAMADWVVARGDAQGLPFVVIDKVHAQVAAFDAQGQLQGAGPALLGAARGDVSPPGAGTMKLADITPAMRITPAGRFEAGFGHDFGPHDVLWVDYDDAIALHRVVTSNATERRLERLATPSVLDNRISYGCINVPVRFYEGVIQPLFKPANGIVYILPETATFGKLTDRLEAGKTAR